MKTPLQFLELITEGVNIITVWKWGGVVTKIDKNQFKHDQGIYVTRFEDGEQFCVGPDDVVSISNPEVACKSYIH